MGPIVLVWRWRAKSEKELSHQLLVFVVAWGSVIPYVHVSRPVGIFQHAGIQDNGSQLEAVLHGVLHLVDKALPHHVRKTLLRLGTDWGG